METGRGASGVSRKPPSFAGPASIAPVGLEVTAEVDTIDEEPQEPADATQHTASIPVPMPRRRLGGIVVAAVAGCALILVAAVIARVSHASSEPQTTAALAKDIVKDPPQVTDNTKAPASQADPAPANSPSTATAAAAGAPALPDPPTTGTLRVERPATPGRVWVDGKKLTSQSALVSCGPHQIRIGIRGRTRTVQVPCDGELVVSK
jgi:hypothetical protein